MRHIIYSTYKDILHDIENLTTSNDYKDVISLVTDHLKNSSKNNLDDEENKLVEVNNSVEETIEHLISNLKIDIEAINRDNIFDYVMKEYEKKRYDQLVDEAEKILKVLDQIGFVSISFSSFGAYFINNSLLDPSYFESKYYVESLDNELFISDFGKTLHFVTDENVEYVNNIISITEKKGRDETKNIITKRVLQEIKYLVYTLNQLKEIGVTTRTYESKIDAYRKLMKKGLEVFGVEINNTIPFANPLDLYHQIDYTLSRSLLNNEQKKTFYSEFNIREKIPKATETEDTFKKNDVATQLLFFVKKHYQDHDDNETSYYDDLHIDVDQGIDDEREFLKNTMSININLDEDRDSSITKEHLQQQLKQYQLLKKKFLTYPLGQKLVLDELGLDFTTFDWYQK